MSGPPTTTVLPVTTSMTSPIVTTTPGVSSDEYVYATDLAELGEVDPVPCSGDHCRAIILNTMDALVWYPSKTGELKEPEGQLADTWTIAPDGSTYTFHIRDGVKFWGGNPVTAADVRYTFQRFLAYNNPTGFGWLLLPWLTGHQAGEYIPWDDISKAITVDNATNRITFHLTVPTGVFLSNLAFPIFGVYEAKYAMEHGSYIPGQNVTGLKDSKMSSGENIMGSGPYRLTELIAGEGYVLTRNDNYWGGPPKIKTVKVLYVPEWSTRLLMLKRGQVDAAAVSPDVASQVKSDPSLKLFVAPNSGFTEAIFFNYNIPVQKQPAGTQGIASDWFRDIHLRRAFAYAFPYEDYAKQAYLGYAPLAGPAGWLPPGQLGSAPNGYPYSYDPAKATEEFKLAWGGKVWENGFTITYGYQDFMKGPALIGGQLYAESLQKINPKFKLIPALGNWPSFFDWPLAMAVGQNGPDANWISTVYGVGGWGTSYTSYDNDALNKLLVQGAAETDTAKREQIYTDVNALIATDLPYILTVYWPYLMAELPSLQGYVYSAAWQIQVGYAPYISKSGGT